MPINRKMFQSKRRDPRPGCLGALLLLLLPISVGWLWWLQQEQSAEQPGAQPKPAPQQPKPGRPAPAKAPASAPALAARDDLTRILGVGPKVRSLLAENGITTFAGLAQTPVARLEAILEAAGLPMINPETWPEQARELGGG